MTLAEEIITIAICAAGTMLTRFLPFIIFRKGDAPKFIRFLGNALPGAVFAMLVVYCLKGISFAAATTALPELISAAAVVLIHLWKRKMLLSISVGTVLYMVLVQLVF